MNRISRKKNANYTTISNECFKDKELSLKARGFLCTVMSLPDSWDFTVKGIEKILKDGRDSVHNAITELIKLGYCKRVRLMEKAGRFAGYDYVFAENRCFASAPDTGLPDTGLPDTGNQQQLSTKEVSNQLLKKKEVKKKGVKAALDFFSAGEKANSLAPAATPPSATSSVEANAEGPQTPIARPPLSPASDKYPCITQIAERYATGPVAPELHPVPERRDNMLWPWATPEFKNAWWEWVQHRAEKTGAKDFYTHRQESAALLGLAQSSVGGGQAAAIETIRHSIENGWKSLHPNKDFGNGQHTNSGASGTGIGRSRNSTNPFGGANSETARALYQELLAVTNKG